MKNGLGTHEDLAFLKDRFKIATLPCSVWDSPERKKNPYLFESLQYRILF